MNQLPDARQLAQDLSRARPRLKHLPDGQWLCYTMDLHGTGRDMEEAYRIWKQLADEILSRDPLPFVVSEVTEHSKLVNLTHPRPEGKA
jgi:hypothetical protein